MLLQNSCGRLAAITLLILARWRPAGTREDLAAVLYEPIKQEFTLPTPPRQTSSGRDSSWPGGSRPTDMNKL